MASDRARGNARSSNGGRRLLKATYSKPISTSLLMAMSGFSLAKLTRTSGSAAKMPRKLSPPRFSMPSVASALGTMPMIQRSILRAAKCSPLRSSRISWAGIQRTNLNGHAPILDTALICCAVSALGRPGLRDAVGADAHQAMPDQVGDPAVDRAADIERVGGVDRLVAVDDQVLLRAERLELEEGPDVADADAALVDDGVLLEHRLVEGQRILRVDQEGLRLGRICDLLHAGPRLAPRLPGVLQLVRD